MDETVRIRRALEPDLAAITAIYAYYVENSTSTFEVDSPGIHEMARRWSEIATRGMPYVVADIGGLVVGYAYAGVYRPRRAYRFTVEDSVYVHHDYVGRGIGRTLLSAIIESCQAAGIQQIVAIIGDSANVESVRLHAAHGFRMVGTLEGVGLKFGRWLDTVMMQRALRVDAPPPS